jgi:hypothetical protein
MLGCDVTTFDVPERYLAAAAPIIITSPTTRCGTTLVQRLLSASDNAFLYGEGVGHHIVALTQSFVTALRNIEQHGGEFDAHLERALIGVMDDWQPGLMAPSNVMLRGWTETYYQLPVVLSEFGRSIGRPIWGFKLPALSHDVIAALLRLMPRARVIYVFRSPFDALKSAKARKFVKSGRAVAQFAAAWAQNMSEASAFASDGRFLLLRYETLIQQPIPQMRILEAFTQVEGVRASTFETKVNTFKGDGDLGYSPTQYIQPQELTDAERRAVRSRAGPMADRFYGGI